MRWLQHRGRANGSYGRLLREDFGFHALSVGDCFSRSHLPKVAKVDIYDESLFIVLLSFHLSDKRHRVETVEMDMYVGNNYMVCVHPRHLRELGRARGRFLSRDEFVYSPPANVAHAVLDAVVDAYLPIMNRLSAMVDGIEEQLCEEDENVPANVLESFLHLKPELDCSAPPCSSTVRRRGPLDKVLRPAVRAALEDTKSAQIGWT